MELSKRLRAIVDLVEEGELPADIGCDHGYVSICLMEEQKCSSVIAMDINQGPLLRAKENIERKGLSPYIETRLSDGAAALEDGEADTLICAGMGGKLTLHILEDAMKRLSTIKTLILQPQSEIWLVRRFLFQNYYVIVREDMVYEDGKYYPMMRAEKAAREVCGPYTQKEELYGPLLLKEKHPVLFQYLQKEKETARQTIERLSPEQEAGDISRRLERKKELLERLRCIEECLAGF
ncbi:MAG: SAM-dependent methyltransferase [Lachnospiraceae bacterium]|nr:SAM-dependent methyltransferase [Lachnospiraceae bacterium]